MSAEQLQALEAYTACDVADALLKLGVKGAGFLRDIKPIPGVKRSTTSASSSVAAAAPPLPPTTSLTSAEAEAIISGAGAAIAQQQHQSPPSPAPAPVPANITSQSRSKIVAPISTFLFLAKSSPSFPDAAPPLAAITQTISTPFSNIASGVPYADLTRPGTIVVISQPAGQSCAVVGGIMAARMKQLGAKAVIVDGRVRDLGALRGFVQEEDEGEKKGGMPIWSRGTSIIGSGAETKAWCTDVEVQVGEALVCPGDVGMVDEEELGVVVIPRALVGDVLRMLPKLVQADERVMDDVLGGGEVGAAFAKYRGK